ncbi:MAG: trigger factor, partial [Eubacteriales bacterium]|nr:trigger factor [Eubacteriales bacterium]
EKTTEKETEEKTEDQTKEKKDAAASSADATASEATPTDATSADAEELKKPVYTASDYVKLGQYKGLEITVDPIQVTEDEIDAEIESAIVRSGKREELKEGTVKNGDVAVIDFVGKKDDVAFDGGTAKDYELEIGSHTFIEGFEEGVEGMKVGETKDLELTFPENYPSEDLAGADVIFTVTVNAIKKMPELTDELVKELSSESKTVEEFREEVKEALEANKVEQQRGTELQKIYALLVQNCEVVEYPQELLDYGVSQFTRNYTNYAEQYGMSLEDFIQGMFGMTLEQFEEQALINTKETARQEMLLKAIAEKEDLELTEEEYKEGLKKYTSDYGFASEEALLEANSEEIVRDALLQDKVMQFLLDNAVITEVTAADATKADAESEETETETEKE